MLERDGSGPLELPYNHPAELAMDVLRYGSGVEVLAPADLRRRARDEPAGALARYEPGPAG